MAARQLRTLTIGARGVVFSGGGGSKIHPGSPCEFFSKILLRPDPLVHLCHGRSQDSRGEGSIWLGAAQRGGIIGDAASDI